jgi:hypothetical protein
MEILNEIYQELYDEGVFFYTGDYGLDGECDSVIVSDGSRYGIFLDIQKVRTPLRELMAISHEYGHFKTGSLYSLDADEVTRRRAENRADKAQIRRLIPQADYKAALAGGCRSVYELAEHFSVTEDFMRKAVTYYQTGRLSA